MSDGKACTKCGVWKGFGEFYAKSTHSSGHSPWCKACSQEDRRKRYEANPGLNAEINRRWRKANPEKCKEIYRAQSKRGIADGRRSRAQQKQRAELSSCYVRSLISESHGVPASAIPQEAVNLKREQIRLQRLVKELQQAQPKELK